MNKIYNSQALLPRYGGQPGTGSLCVLGHTESLSQAIWWIQNICAHRYFMILRRRSTPCTCHIRIALFIHNCLYAHLNSVPDHQLLILHRLSVDNKDLKSRLYDERQMRAMKLPSSKQAKNSYDQPYDMWFGCQQANKC